VEVSFYHDILEKEFRLALAKWYKR
jgi:hypothetical protein